MRYFQSKYAAALQAKQYAGLFSAVDLMRRSGNLCKRASLFTLLSILAAMFCTVAVAQPAPVKTDASQAQADKADTPVPQENAPAQTVQTVKQALSLPAADASRDDIARFCKNIDNMAQDARVGLQMRQLEALRTEIDGRIKILEEKRKSYEDWLAKRNAFLAKTQDSFVGIVSKMRPDAAAAQLALVDEMAAASIILKLEPRISSAIMNEMPPEKSANLMRILVSAQKLPAEKTSHRASPAQQPAGAAP